MSAQIRVKLLNERAEMPIFAHEGDAGCDLIATDDIAIPAGGVEMVSTGIAIALPKGYEAQIRPRSGLAAHFGITVLNTPGTIDCQYRGEIKVILYNTSHEKFVVCPGMRIAQMVIAKLPEVEYVLVDELDKTERNENGFGSTGIK